jgi:regulator of replication initiation timing
MKPKGGRGHTVPYRSHSLKVPEPVLEQVREMVDRYHFHLHEGGDVLSPPRFLKAFQADESVPSEPSEPTAEVEKLRLKVAYLRSENQRLERKNNKLHKEFDDVSKTLNTFGASIKSDFENLTNLFASLEKLKNHLESLTEKMTK